MPEFPFLDVTVHREKTAMVRRELLASSRQSAWHLAPIVDRLRLRSLDVTQRDAPGRF
jgi:hypothetical protein